ncbi:MAG TPA: hypothetical protein VFQ39_18105 [Longimicrobium sp.]|nr:hypothetical protein [Longimicrobium sp.]
MAAPAEGSRFHLLHHDLGGRASAEPRRDHGLRLAATAAAGRGGAGRTAG